MNYVLLKKNRQNREFYTNVGALLSSLFCLQMQVLHAILKILTRVSLYPVSLYPGMTGFPDSISRDFPGFGIFSKMRSNGAI